MYNYDSPPVETFDLKNCFIARTLTYSHTSRSESRPKMFMHETPSHGDINLINVRWNELETGWMKWHCVTLAVLRVCSRDINLGRVRNVNRRRTVEALLVNELLKLELRERKRWRILSIKVYALESRFGESESNRHHPAVAHNYTFSAVAAINCAKILWNISKHYKLTQFSSLSHYRRTKNRVKVTLTRSWSQRSSHTNKKHEKHILFCW